MVKNKVKEHFMYTITICKYLIYLSAVDSVSRNSTVRLSPVDRKLSVIEQGLGVRVLLPKREWSQLLGI